MASAKKLINKLFRKERFVRTHQKEFDHYDKSFLGEEIIDRENKIERLMRKISRRLERAFGFAVEAHKPFMSTRQKVDVARVVYLSGHAIQLSMANSSILEYEGILPGDIVVFLNGHLKGQNLAVVNVPDASHLLLEDYLIPAVAEKTQITAVADSSGSLNNTYFDINSADDANKYYVWYNVSGGGTDPAVVGRTGVEVDIATNATAAQVASATAAALALLNSSADFSAVASGAVITVRNKMGGATTDASDAGSTGFSISVLVQGADAAAPSESNITVRINLGGVKNDYEK